MGFSGRGKAVVPQLSYGAVSLSFGEVEARAGEPEGLKHTWVYPSLPAALRKPGQSHACLQQRRCPWEPPTPRLGNSQCARARQSP